jgi:cystathionine beta-lyase/cystathionine gamma-synthase
MPCMHRVCVCLYVCRRWRHWWVIKLYTMHAMCVYMYLCMCVCVCTEFNKYDYTCSGNPTRQALETLVGNQDMHHACIVYVCMCVCGCWQLCTWKTRSRISPARHACTHTFTTKQVCGMEGAHAAFAFTTGMAALSCMTRLLQSGMSHAFMCVCVHVCVYVCMYIFIHNTHIHIYMHVHEHRDSLHSASWRCT